MTPALPEEANMVGMQPMRCHKCQPVPYDREGIEPARVCTCASPSSQAVPAASEEKLRLATEALERIAGWPGPVGTNVGSLNAAEANGLRRTIAREALARIRAEKPWGPAPP
jgi:hypothetical protein